MSQNAFVKALKMLVQRSDDQQERQDQIQTVNMEGKSRFSFKPGKSVTEQLNSFKLRVKNNRWNNEISVQNYQGTFKVEHWIYIEQSLRSLPDIKLLQFVQTQLDKEHLNVLGRLINWLSPQNFELILEQNEIDDQDVEEFIYEILRNKINFKKIYIISNPGLYKSHFLEQLEQYLEKNQNQSSAYYYLLIKDEKMHSIALIKIYRKNTDDQNALIISEAKKDINKTCFYGLNLAECFDEDNYTAFYNLIEQLYHEDHLEQLVSLNIDYNFLGEVGQFSKACQLFSTSKGLLKLEVANQALLHNSVSCESLCGNRYDQFRVNELSIKDNVKMSPKAFELLSYSILGDLKRMNLDDSLPAEIPTLLKIFYLIDSYDKKISNLQQLSKQDRVLYKLNLEELDLSKLENYNRHDLMYKLIKSTCFNFHTNLKKLSISNCDAGRMEAYYKAYNDFVVEIEANKNHIIYGNFKIPLEEIVIPTQRYSMTQEINYQFLKKLVFTTEDDYLQIKKVSFLDSCFNVSQRTDAFNQILEEILVKENVKYTLKEFKAVSTSHTLESQHLKALLFNKNMQLEHIILQDTSVSLYSESFEENLTSFIQELEESHSFYSLKSFKFMNCYGASLEFYSLIHYMVFSESSQLEELQLKGISINLDNDNKQKLLQYLSSGSQSIRKLKKLDVGVLTGEDTVNSEILQYLILNKLIRLDELTMSDFPLSELLESVVQQNINLDDENHQLSQIRTLSLNSIAFQSQKQWKLFIQYFLFNQHSRLQNLYLRSMNISDILSKAFQEVFQELQPKFEKDQIQITQRLKSLKLDMCEIQTEFLIVFIMNPFCKLEELEFVNCHNFDTYLMQTKNLMKENDLKSVLTLSLVDFKAINTDIQEAFEWFFQDIVFNEYKQKVQSLTLQNCSLRDKDIQVLCKIIQNLKQNQALGAGTRKFKLKDIDLSRNKNIPSKQWNNLFSLILDVKQNEQEVKQQEEDTPQEDGELEERIKKVQDGIIQGNLNLHDKILNMPQKFNFSPPTQLKILELDLNLTYLKEEQSRQLYKALVCGIIIHPQSNLKRLKLSTLNLEYFMTYVEEYFSFGKQLLSNSDQPQFHFPLEDLEILTLVEESEKNVKQFVSYFICCQHIDLKRLQLSGFYQGVVREILEQSSQKEKYYLNELRIGEITECLNRQDSIKFFKQIIFGGLFPIEILEIGEGLIFEGGKITTNDWNGSNKFEGDLLLQKLILHSGGYDLDRLETISGLMNEILSNTSIKLEELTIKGTGYECRCFDEFYQKGINLMKKLPIRILRIENTICIDEQFLKLLSRLRLTLTELKLQCLSSFAQTKEALQEVFDPFKQKCSLFINEVQGDAEEIKMIQEEFCFSKQLAFDFISYKHLGSFQSIAIGQSFKHLKHLEFAFNLFYNDYSQLDEESLTVIGDNFIYNLESSLEELTFHQCHLKPPGLIALTQKAEAFKNEIEKQGKQGSAQLSLKRFNIYYSLYIEQEGANLINSNILFFEYISIERIELEVTNWANDYQNDMCKKALSWLKFQKQFKREYINYFPIKYFDIGRNEFVQTEEAWKLICQTFLFSDLTPQLEIVNIHFMALTDAQVEVITNQAKLYFDSKPKGYIYPVKRLDFSFNSSLTYKGWLDASKNFFFHPKVELQEINLSNTTLDNEQKIMNIVNSGIAKALSKSNKKLSLHTLLTYNAVLKQHLNQYLSPQPEKYGPPHDIPVEVDYEMANVGWYGGTPEEFGYFNQLQSNLLYNNEIFRTEEWVEQRQVKLSQYHFSIGFNYIKILNDYYQEQNQQNLTLYFDLSTLDTFCGYFKYTTKQPGQPYPYALLFQEDTFLQLKQSNSIVSKIHIISSKVEGLEKISFSFIVFIWENIKSHQSSIDQIVVDYYLDDDLIDYMFNNGYTEKDIVQLIRLIPPSKIRIQNSLSLQAIKAIYSIFYDTANFEYSSIQYDFDNFLNIGIGYALREVAYSMRSIGCRRYLKKVMYPVCNFFVQQTKEYKFNSEVTELNQFLAHQQVFLFLLVLNNIAFLGICILSPYFFSHFYVSDSASSVRLDYCINGPNKVAAYLYYAFAALSLVLEGYIYKRVIEYVPSFLEKLQIQIYPNEEEQLDNEIGSLKNADDPERDAKKKKSVLQSAQTKFDQFANSSQGYWIVFFKTIITSQLAKYDQFNDICFILTCYYCDEMILFYLVLALQIFIQVLNVFGFFNQVLMTIISKRSNNKQLSTQFINEFYRISLAGKNLALAQMLDQVAPFNVDIIPNNFITRFLMPKQAGKAINSSIKGYLIQFTFEDMPQIIILIIFLVRQAIKNGVLKWNIIITLITSSIAVVNSFYKFMSIRPTYLAQDHFDDLSLKKTLSKKDSTLKYLNNEQEQIEIFTNVNKKSETLININESAPLL